MYFFFTKIIDPQINPSIRSNPSSIHLSFVHSFSLSFIVISLIHRVASMPLPF